jgi:hypothetical protein
VYDYGRMKEDIVSTLSWTEVVKCRCLVRWFWANKRSEVKTLQPGGREKTDLFSLSHPAGCFQAAESGTQVIMSGKIALKKNK